MTPEERAAAIGAQFPPNGITYTYLGITFNVTNCVVSGPAVSVHVLAWTGAGGNRVDLPTDNPYIFVNPPLMIPDGGTQVILDPHGNPRTVPSFTRNDLVAAQQIIYDAVTLVAKRLGWVP